MKSLYCVCDECTAKWFCPRPPTCCPRCGSREFGTTRARRPWSRGLRSTTLEPKPRSTRGHNFESESSRPRCTLLSLERYGDGSA